MKTLLLQLLLTSGYYSQNLVVNGSFEETSDCSFGIANLKAANGWYSPSSASPDYYNRCMDSIHSRVPCNLAGCQVPKTGNAYAGIVAYFPEKEYREYLEGTIVNPLVKGKAYQFTMSISLAEASTQFIDYLEVYFVRKKAYPYSYKRLKARPHISFSIKNFSDTSAWKTLTGSFIANGDEEYFLAGVFRSKDSLDVRKRHFTGIKQRGAYYYIDDVSLVELKDTTSKAVQALSKNATDTIILRTDFEKAKEQPIVLKNVFFNTAESILLPASYIELDLLVGYLKENANYKLEISGHTDNVGKEKDNLQLSEARAKAVVDYLISKNISALRISYKGFGSLQPIVTNGTSEGRQQNRRVEARLF